MAEQQHFYAPYRLFHLAKSDRRMELALCFALYVRRFTSATLFSFSYRQVQRLLHCRYSDARDAVNFAVQMGMVRFEETKRRGTCIIAVPFDKMKDEFMVKICVTKDKSEDGRHIFIPSNSLWKNKRQSSRKDYQDLHDLKAYIKMTLILNSCYWWEHQHDEYLKREAIRTDKGKTVRRYDTMRVLNHNVETIRPWEVTDLNMGLTLQTITDYALGKNDGKWTTQKLLARMRREGLLSWTHGYTLVRNYGDYTGDFHPNQMSRYNPETGEMDRAYFNKGVGVACRKFFDGYDATVTTRRLGNMFTVKSEAFTVQSSYRRRCDNKNKACHKTMGL